MKVNSKTRAEWVAAQGGPLEAIAYHDLNGRPGFKLAMHQAGSRLYLYVAHLWHSGWTVLDVTDPSTPKQVGSWTGPPNTWTLQVTIRDGLMATSMEQIQSGLGGEGEAAFDEGVILWDLTDPLKPRRRSTFRTSHLGTHRNILGDGGLLHLAARMPGYSGAIYLIVDVSDPDAPREIGRFHMPGQHSAAGEHISKEWYDLHGPAIHKDSLAYLPYASAGLVILDISSPGNPVMVGNLDVHPPLGSGIAVHTVIPMPGHDGKVILNSEALAERCDEPVGFAAVADVSDPSKPMLVSLFPTPAPPPGATYSSFCARGGRFGPHNQHMPTGDPYVFDGKDFCFLTYFNAGLRVYDVRDPYLVKEVAYLIPDDPVKRYGPLPTDLVVQVEDVLVDSRGIAYFTEKNSGLYIAEWKGL